MVVLGIFFFFFNRKHCLLFLWTIKPIFLYVLYQQSNFYLKRFNFYFLIFFLSQFHDLAFFPLFLPLLPSPTSLLYNAINSNEGSKKWRREFLTDLVSEKLLINLVCTLSVFCALLKHNHGTNSTKQQRIQLCNSC